jgi:hypothetical protein
MARFDPTLLKRCGAALYGHVWVPSMAEALGVSERTVRRWAAKPELIPAGVYFEIYELCQRRVAEIAGLSGELTMQRMRREQDEDH